MNDPLRQQLQTSLGTDYTIERELGGGGMSRVFVAEETRFRRRVVIKVLAPELAAGVSAERFEREIALAARLQHAHVVPVLAAGEVDGLPWYSMPYVEGESLRARLERGTVPLPEAVAVLRDVARALAYAHARGIVHRDIKPENVLLSGGAAVVTDFGIAKALSVSKTQAPDGPAGVGTLTQVGTSLGSPAYMAPEQAAGDPDVDARADLYAWGVMAYELLAGRHPFAGRTTVQQLVAAHMAEVPASLQQVAPAVPAPLAALVMRALAKDQDARPASAAALLEALDGAAVTQPSSWRGHSRWLAGAAAGGALFLALGGGALAWRARAATAGEPPLVAVLPFESIAIGADSVFADGLSDAVTGKLAQLAGLRVIDRGSVLAVHEAAASPQAAGKRLGAMYVLRAVVRWGRAGDGTPQVQVTPRLVRVVDGTTHWAGEPHVVSPADPFIVQADIATAVAEALDVALGRAERARLARAATRDTAALAAFERGRRIARQSTARPDLVVEQALREFERAYTLDPEYADALGWAANALQLMAQVVNDAPLQAALYDSAATLARRALVIDPGQVAAVSALTTVELVHERPENTVQLLEPAVAARPSSADLLALQASMLTLLGDTARAWHPMTRAAALAPQSAYVFGSGFQIATALRRYDDARELLVRWRTLEPENPRVDEAEARLADLLGDSAGVARALRTYRAKGGAIRGYSQAFVLMRRADSALARELANCSLETFDAASGPDSVYFYWQKAQLFLARGDTARSRPLVDSAYRQVARMMADSSTDSPYSMRYGRRMQAWLAAARGDRAEALAALEQAGASPAIRLYPDGAEAGQHTVASAEVHGLLGDVAAMLPHLRRAITMPNGPSAAALLTEPAFRRYRDDPRFRALATMQPVAVRRPE